MFRWSDSDSILFFIERWNKSKRDSSTAQTGYFAGAKLKEKAGLLRSE
jgi:hypothetical protein